MSNFTWDQWFLLISLGSLSVLWVIFTWKVIYNVIVKICIKLDELRGRRIVATKSRHEKIPCIVDDSIFLILCDQLFMHLKVLYFVNDKKGMHDAEIEPSFAASVDGELFVNQIRIHDTEYVFTKQKDSMDLRIYALKGPRSEETILMKHYRTKNKHIHGCVDAIVDLWDAVFKKLVDQETFKDKLKQSKETEASETATTTKSE